MDDPEPDRYEVAVMKALRSGREQFLKIDVFCSNEIGPGYRWRRTDRTLQKLRKRGRVTYDRLNGWLIAFEPAGQKGGTRG